MKKSVLLGICNLFLAFWFTLILVKSHYSFAPFVSVYAVVKAYASLFIIFLLDMINLSVAYYLLIKKPKKISYPLTAAITFAPLFWFMFTFIGFFFASHLFLPVITLLIALTSYVYFRRYSHRTALFLSLGTIVILCIVLLSSFEEDYCFRQGVLADPTGGKFIQATKEDEKLLTFNHVKKGDEIGVAFRAHMLCHANFNLGQAIQKSYFHL